MQLPNVFIRQKREIAEVFGIETRNKYSIETTQGQQIAFAAEQRTGFFGFLFRQSLGHWRRYSIHVFDNAGQIQWIAHHPFRFYYQRVDVRDPEGRPMGSIERRFEIFGKRFVMLDTAGNELMNVHSPLWTIWTFRFKRNGEELAIVTKKWGGIIKEAFLDADSFLLQFNSTSLTEVERVLLVTAALFIDLRYFEKKASTRGVRPLDYFLAD